ncbi:MAG: energy transducer TonB, partial [Gemmatimonadota bacterium]|nr:energy transducer TonB [Gemmatimonadota bacterium]
MMRLWMATYAERPRIGTSAVLSTVLHGALIAAAVIGTLQAPERMEQRIEEAVRFLPPPDRVHQAAGPAEPLHFVVLAPVLPAPANVRLPVRRLPPGLPRVQDDPRPVVVPVPPRAPSADSVLSVLEVDSTVERYPESAAPAYPPALLAKHVEGSVATTYVVDTTGFADTTSLKILSASDSQFARSVREALPYMRFRPAILRNQKVRQLVSQTFLFRIRPPAPDSG